MNNTKSALLAFVASVLVVGCGGGGGGNPTTPPPAVEQFTVTVSSSENGNIAPSGTFEVNQGESKKFILVPNSGYTCGVMVNGGALITLTICEYTFIGTEDATLTAVFTPQPPPGTYNIELNVAEGVMKDVLFTAVPGNYTCTTLASGTCTINVPDGVTYTVTPSHADNPVFTPSALEVPVNGADVTGVKFTTPLPMHTMGKIVYPCSMAICEKDLATGIETVIWGAYNIYPETIVPYRNAAKLGFIGGNIGGISTLSLSTLTTVMNVNGSGLLAPGCISWPTGMFDFSPAGDFAAIESICSPLGQASRSDIFLVLADGSLFWVRVTNDIATDSFPTIAGVDSVTGETTVIFLSDKSGVVGIWKQLVNPATDTLVGPQVLLASNALSGTRAISVNAEYTHFAFMKNIDGVSHIVVMPIAGGAEVDLGRGTDPYWALDGSDLIMYTSNDARFVVKKDGTGRASIPAPSNLVYGLGNIVFGPPGF